MATLISHFKFENDYADAVGSNTLTAQGAGQSFSSSIFKFGAYSLNTNRPGSGYGKKTSQTGINTGNADLSFGGWFYFPTLAETDAAGGIGVSSANTRQNIWFQKTSATNFNVDLGSDQLSFTVPAMSTNTFYWCWLQYTASTKTSDFYLNNVQSSSGAQAHAGNLALAATTDIRVGADIDGNNSSSGYIDDFRFYNGVTSATERATIFTNISAIAGHFALII